LGSKPVSLVIKKGRQRQFGRWECKDNTDCITIELDVTKPRGVPGRHSWMVSKRKYTVSQKTRQLWQAVVSTSMN